MADLDHLLSLDIAEAAADAAEPPAFAEIERRGVQRRHRRAALSAFATTAVLAVVLLVARQGLPGADESAPLLPAGPTPTVGTPARTDVVVPGMTGLGDPSQTALIWLDRGDVPVGAADIRRLEVSSAGSSPLWTFALAAPYPSEASLDAQSRVIEYGLVIDSNLDLVPDCEIGMSNDNDTTSEPGDLRVWVKNLRNGVIAQRTAPPYGVPVEFAHPYEANADGTTPEVRFLFLKGTGAPCDGAGDSDNIYVWAEVRDNGQVVARDVAPDTAWLRVQ